MEPGGRLHCRGVPLPACAHAHSLLIHAGVRLLSSKGVAFAFHMVRSCTRPSPATTTRLSRRALQQTTVQTHWQTSSATRPSLWYPSAGDSASTHCKAPLMVWGCRAAEDGYGVVAAAAIPKDTWLVEYRGLVSHESVWADRLNQIGARQNCR